MGYMLTSFIRMPITTSILLLNQTAITHDFNKFSNMCCFEILTVLFGMNMFNMGIITTHSSNHSVEFASKSSPDPVPLDKDVHGHGRSHGRHPIISKAG